MLQHRQGEAAEWTTLHRMIRIHCVWEIDNDFMEDNKVKEYMLSFGIDCVRGGSYSQIELSPSQRQFLEDELRTARNACLNCGQVGHFEGQCTALIRLPEVPQITTRNQQRAYARRNDDDRCFRCGRPGHWADECYARTDYRGQRLN